MKKINNNLPKIFLIITFVIFSFLVFTGAKCSIKEGILGGFNPTEAKTEDVEKAVSKFAGLMAGAASTVALIFIIIGGIQYITSAGNQEQATKGKSTLTWAIIGFILIIASYSIIAFFTDLLSKK